MFLAIFALWIALIVLFLFYKFPIGVYLYLVYIFLVPFMQISVGVTLSWNLVNMVLALATYVFYRKEHLHIDWSIMTPFFLLYIVQLLVMPLQDETPVEYMLHAFRADIMTTLIVPTALMILCQSQKISYKVLKCILLVCIGVACIYGLVLTMTPGINPYIMIISELNEVDYLETYYLAEDGGRLFGRISSVYDDPMRFALFLGLSFIYVFSQKENINKWIFASLMMLIVVNCVTCGVRSVLGGLAITAVYYFYKQRNLKTAALFGFVGLIGYLVVINIPELNAYLGSISQDNSDNVNGSSLEMRLDQLGGALTEFANNPILGKGFHWHLFYMSEHGAHPVLLYFESLVYVILCNSGIIGVLLWLYVSLKYFKINSKILKDSSLLNSFWVFYLAYASITGDYAYMQLFLLFYVIAVFTSFNVSYQNDYDNN